MSPDHNSSDAASAMPDALLLAAIGEGDVAAMGRFYARHATCVYSVALQVLRDPESAEEVLQATFLGIWRDPAELLATPGSLAGWLAVAARHRAVAMRRGREPTEMDWGVAGRMPQGLAAEIEDEATRDRVRRGMARLPKEEQLAVEMAFFPGLRPDEIAMETGMPAGVVKSRIRAGLRALGGGFLAGD